MNENEIKWLVTLRNYQDNEHGKFSLKLPDEYMCSLCQYVLVYPVQAPCGCRFCKDCLSGHLGDRSSFCPGVYDDCRRERISFKKDVKCDFAVFRDMKRLRIRCPNESCAFETELPALFSHLDECPFGERTCALCLQKYLRKNEVGHLTIDCEQRLLKCERCNSMVSFKDMRGRHVDVCDDDVCQGLFLDCPYSCDVGGPVCIKDHRKTCSNRPMKCPFAVIGCNYSLVSGVNLRVHLENEAHAHVIMMIVLGEEKDRQILLLRKVYQNLVMEVEDLGKEIKELEKEMEVESVPCAREEQPLNLVNEEVFRSGSFIWKIEYFDRISSDAKIGKKTSIISDAFYSSDFGYRMCLKIYPLGDGLGKGTHVSLFIVLMRGDFDALLSWPFQGKIRVAMLSARDRSVQHSETYALSGESACFSRPTGEYNIATGNPKFLPIESVMSDFVQCNTMFIQASIL